MPDRNRECGFNLRIFVTIMFTFAIICLIIMVTLFVLLANGNTSVSSVFSFASIGCMFGLPAGIFILAACIAVLVYRQFLRGWDNVFARFMSFFPEHWRNENDQQRGNRGIMSILLDLLIPSWFRNRRPRSIADVTRRQPENVQYSTECDAVTVHSLSTSPPLQQSTGMQRILDYERTRPLSSRHGILGSSLPPRTDWHELQQRQLVRNPQPGLSILTPATLLLHDELNRNQTRSDDLPQQTLAGPSVIQQRVAGVSAEAHFQSRSRVHRRNPSYIQAACTGNEQRDPQPWFLAGPSGTQQRDPQPWVLAASSGTQQRDPQPWVLAGPSGPQQRETESNFYHRTPLSSFESGCQYPEFVSEQTRRSRVQRSETLSTEEEVHLPRQIHESLCVHLRRRRESRQTERCNKTSSEESSEEPSEESPDNECIV